nr:uracil-DNA glycosylase [Halalkalibacillus halophilus]
MLLPADWYNVLKVQTEQTHFKELIANLEKQYTTSTILPEKHNIFRAFQLTPFEQVKVVILGQDPYHGIGQANGLSFSVNRGMKIPPSLRNIYKELQQDVGCQIPDHGDLSNWAKQGVLLLNTSLTVEEGKPNSHQHIGWQEFTNTVIEQISERKESVVFILWGKNALSRQNLINTNRHRIVHAPHPSPLAAHRGFFESNPFSQTNKYLQLHYQQTIEWCNL